MDYVTKPAHSECYQVFEYRMSGGERKPNKLTIDANTGILTLENSLRSETTFLIDIVIVTTSGKEINTQTLVLEQVEITVFEEVPC